jgi:Leucine-rich repeat (LRR) protein
MRDTLTNVFLGENDLTELPKERSASGNGDNNHYNGNGNGNGGGTEAGNGSGASLAECRMLTWLNLDSNKVNYTGYLNFGDVSPASLAVCCVLT